VVKMETTKEAKPYTSIAHEVGSDCNLHLTVVAKSKGKLPKYYEILEEAMRYLESIQPTLQHKYNKFLWSYEQKTELGLENQKTAWIVFEHDPNCWCIDRPNRQRVKWAICAQRLANPKNLCRGDLACSVHGGYDNYCPYGDCSTFVCAWCAGIKSWSKGQCRR
jgi:hypothetical protein